MTVITRKPWLAVAMWSALIGGCRADAQPPRPEAVDATYLTAQRVPSTGPLVRALRIADKGGEHLLVLTRKAGPSPSQPKSGRAEHIDLLATYYDRANGGWTSQWTIRDNVDCPGLDAAAEFFTDAVAVTDINGDGRAEVTVPYRLFCGGGIEPSTVKVILRDGAVKLAIRGESTIRLPGQEPFGGDHQYDKALLQPANAAFKRHLDQVWQKVSVEKRQ